MIVHCGVNGYFMYNSQFVFEKILKVKKVT